MPCGDINEHLELELDADERLVRFSLRKRSCGAPVGEISDLEPWVAGRTASQLLGWELEQLPPDAREKAIQRFLLGKQLEALVAALAVYFGQAAGGATERFSVESIAYDERGATIVGQWSVAAAPEQVSPCGGCSCSSAGASQRC